MILDKLANSARYANVHPRFQQAFDFLISNDMNALPLGKTELDGSDLVVNIVEVDGKTTEQARMETHANFIDIQIPLNQTEKMGWKAASDLETVTMEYDTVKDLKFFADTATTMLEVKPLEFAVFFPEDGHQPGIAEGKLKKIIVKVRV
jgi:YhcH/YjgK/YiaL family protein